MRHEELFSVDLLTRLSEEDLHVRMWQRKCRVDELWMQYVCTLQVSRFERHRDAGTDVRWPMEQWMLDTNNQNKPTIWIYTCTSGSREFPPASPRQLHSMLYRPIIGQPRWNEDDLSHSPPVSVSLEAPVVAEVSNVSAPGEIRWLAAISGYTQEEARWLRRYWVTFLPALPSPAGTRYTEVGSLPIFVECRWL